MPKYTTEDYLSIKDELKQGFSNLEYSFEVTEDGVCLSDVEFALIEFCAELEKLRIMLRGDIL